MGVLGGLSNPAVGFFTEEEALGSGLEESEHGPHF